MSLRFKSLLVFAGAVTLLFGIVVALAKVVIEGQFTAIEVESMSQQASRLSSDLAQEADPVAATVGVWANWDELYEFVSGNRPDFPSRNLNQATLENLHLDFFAIYRSSGELVHLETNSSRLARGNITAATIESAVRTESLVPRPGLDQSASGLMRIGNQIVLVAALPILHGDRSGPPAGTLVGGRIFGETEIENLDRFAGYELELLPLPGPPGANLAISIPHTTQVTIVGRHEILATVPVPGLNAKWIANAELRAGRPLHLQAAKTIVIFVIGLASSAGILLFVVWYLLDSNVINPVRRLTEKLLEAAATGRLPADLGFKGKGELAHLAHRIENLARSVAHAEANYRAIVEDQTEFIFRYRLDGTLTFVNDAVCRYFGRARDEFLREDAHHFIAKEDLRRVRKSLDGLSVESPVTTLDHRVILPRQGLAWFRRTDRAIFSETGELREFQCVARDITHTHQTRERLVASEQRYRRLFETSTDGILIVRQSDRVVTDANSAICRLLGSDRSSLLNRPIETIPAFEARKNSGTILKLLAGTQPVRGAEVTLPAPKDERRYLEVTTGIYEANGETIAQLNFRDISLRRRANEELRQLSGHLLRLQDDERRRIARELHDSTAQNLSALQMALTHIEPALARSSLKARQSLEEIRHLADLSLREIRTISYLLHPPLLDEVGLLFALRWYVDGFMTRTEKIVRLDVPSSLDRQRPEIETAIFRVVQEGLTNIHRHSGSRRAWIRLSVDHGILELIIRDEGSGGAPALNGLQGPGYPVLGVGIAGMRERLRQFNGSLEIDSTTAGTTVRATLPLEPDESSDG